MVLRPPVRPVALALLLALAPQLARAEEAVSATPHERGFLSGLGIALLVGGLGATGLGIGAGLGAGEATRELNAFLNPLPATEAMAFKAVEQRVKDNTTLMVGSFVGAGVLLAAGIVCLVLDAPRVPPVVLVPTRDGAVLSFSARF